MKTITFYSYKGGTGRSLALANAARYLARLEFRVVALDFDLEAPGLHYKFSTSPDEAPLQVEAGVVDYIHSFVVDGVVPKSLKRFTLDVDVPGLVKPLIHLIPAGKVLARDYWSKLARINWHELFYAKGAKGVQVFLDLKNRISDELRPDFLLIDARTGITEMGGVATTLLADKVISLVVPTAENLEGARAVLRSLRRSRRETRKQDLELIVALSRLPQMKDSEGEGTVIEKIKAVLNEEAEDLKDTLSCNEVYVLHSEVSLQVHETLRVGSGISPDDSVLLGDYLRLFATFVSKELVEPKVGKLIQQAREKIWEDPEAATKEVEELAESFGHPETYRALLRFYSVRNIFGVSALRRAQRLWELTLDAQDPALWQIVKRNEEALQRRSEDSQWRPRMDFIESVWRGAGKRDPTFGRQLAEVYYRSDKDSHAADLLLEIVREYRGDARTVARCVTYMDAAKRGADADHLIQEYKAIFSGEPDFVRGWLSHALRSEQPDALSEFLEPALLQMVKKTSPALALRLLVKTDRKEEIADFSTSSLEEIVSDMGPGNLEGLIEVAVLFKELGRLEEFEKVARRSRYLPNSYVDEILDRVGDRRRRR